MSDQEWIPTKAIRNWAKKHASRKYTRKGSGRLEKNEDSKSIVKRSSVGELTQATGLSVSIDNIFSISAPVSRTQSLEEVTEGSKINKCGSEKSTDGSSEDIVNTIKSLFEVKPLAKGIVKNKSHSKGKMGELAESLAKLASQVDKDNAKFLPPLPFFNGKPEKLQSQSNSKEWIEYSCNRFLTDIEDAVNNDRWTEPGKLRTLQDKLLGSARDYWRVRGVEIDTFDKAKAYMLKRFPNKDRYSTLEDQRADFKRKSGESISEMATRIQILHEKICKVVPETANIKERNMKESFFRNLPTIVRDQVEEGDTFDKVVEKSINYLERHKELKLRDQDIQLESTFKVEAKLNNLNVSNKGQENKSKGNKKGNQNNQKEDKSLNNAGNQETTHVNNINSNPNFQQNQRGFRGNNRRGFRNRGNYRGTYRGNFRGNFKGNASNYDNNYNRNYNYRGRSNYRGNAGNYRGRGDRRNYRGNYRGNNQRGRGQSSYNYNNNGNHSELTCYTCGKLGHISPNCRSNGSQRKNNEASNTVNNLCYICSSDQHYARNCDQKN